MKLNLSFTELNPIYNEDYNGIPLSQGVGYWNVIFQRTTRHRISISFCR
jgi:hypothetical protein